MPADSADVVYFDPMYQAPAHAKHAPGFEVVRAARRAVEHTESLAWALVLDAQPEPLELGAAALVLHDDPTPRDATRLGERGGRERRGSARATRDTLQIHIIACTL